MIDYKNIDALFGPPLNELEYLQNKQKFHAMNLLFTLSITALIIFYVKVTIDSQTDNKKTLVIR
jgi:hypothetical protein